MHTFHIRLFGAIEVSREGKPVTGFRSQKTLVLLAYLICQNRPLTRAHLAGLFWPNVTESRALGHLRRALYNLSKNLPGCLDVNRRTVAFHPNAPVIVDIYQFQALAKQNGVELAAVALARAPFLEGVYDSDSSELERWIEQERERWRRETIRLLQRLTDVARRKGRYEIALFYTQKLIALSPWQEENHYRLMQLYVKTGRRHAALAQYAAYRDLLAAEFGLSPSPDLSALHERIRQTPGVSHNLPPSTTPFIGRKQELATLKAMLAAPDHRLITIVGPGGIGKTRLLLAVCRQSLHHYLEGIRFVPLASIATREGMLTALCAAFDLPVAPGEDPLHRLIDHLRHKELLLALDSFEHLTDIAHLLTSVLEETAAITLLVASQRPLGRQEEWVFDLGGLAYPKPGSKHASAALQFTADLLAYEAVQFFCESALRRSPRFNLAGKERAVLEICRLTQGNPRALERAAYLCRDLPCWEIAAEIRRNPDIQQMSLRDLDASVRRDYARSPWQYGIIDG